ncbi:hypothetical protein CCACVL1_14552 [Corchorus capsularis]|uniref:Uncharacterized protein n=1 Tax=Corchorus capsularis TaxID=210143 RepID=A0A1R3I6U3_COCAP|nr:hypothetical protein CCACVL1_14552 [Corchorus capsularis]
MNRVVEEDRVSTIVDKDKILAAGASTSSQSNDEADSGPYPAAFEFFLRNGLAKFEPPDFITMIKKNLAGKEGRNSEMAEKIEVVALHRNFMPSLYKKARSDSFEVFAKTVAQKNGGKANLRFAYYAAPKEELCEIINYGFTAINKTAAARDRNSFRNFITLSPMDFCLDSVLSSEVDECGLRHVLFCRIIAGKQELVTADCNQFHPSSEEFDTGVDDLSVPRKYFVWSVHMNTHIRPLCIVSFKVPTLSANNIKPRLSFPTLMAILSRILTPSQMVELNKFFRDFQEKRVTRLQLIHKVKELGGNRILPAISEYQKKVKFYRLF